MIKPASIALLIASALILSACNQDKPATPEETQAFTEKVVEAAVDTVVTLANPASEYCISIGGELEIKTETDGQVGICHLPSGEQIEEWSLYRKANKQEVTKAVDMVNPAAAYCESLQGKLDLPTGVCTLPSGEAIEHWELFKRDHQQAKPQIGIANPASVYCQSVDGKLDLPTGVCTLPNGKALDQWELLKRDHKRVESSSDVTKPTS